jgi:hypothetical protein
VLAACESQRFGQCDPNITTGSCDQKQKPAPAPSNPPFGVNKPA